MAKATRPAIPAKPTAVAREPSALLVDDGGDDVVAAAPDAPVVAVAVVPVVTVLRPDVDWAEVSAYNY